MIQTTPEYPPISPLEAGLIPFAFPGVPGVHCAFSTGLSGNMSLEACDGPADQTLTIQHRAALMRQCGFTHWAEVYQVHGDAIVENNGVKTPEAEPKIRADGHFTHNSGVGLVIKTADCQPLLITRTDGGAIAALHVGWRGNVLNFPASGIARLCREFSCTPKDLLVVRGPSLGPGAAEFVNFDSEWPAGYQPWFNRKTRTMNLWALTRNQLEIEGVHPANIFSLDLCTHTHATTFFSYRRRHTGRQANLIWRVQD